MSEELIGNNVARYREHRGLSQGALAAEMKDHGFQWVQSTVSAVESGKRPLRLSEARAISDILTVSVSHLLTEEQQGPDLEAMLWDDAFTIKTAYEEAVKAIAHLNWARHGAGQSVIRHSAKSETEIARFDTTTLGAFSGALANYTLPAALVVAYAHELQDEDGNILPLDSSRSQEWIKSKANELAKDGVSVDLAKVMQPQHTPEQMRLILLKATQDISERANQRDRQSPA